MANITYIDPHQRKVRDNKENKQENKEEEQKEKIAYKRKELKPLKLKKEKTDEDIVIDETNNIKKEKEFEKQIEIEHRRGTKNNKK